MRHCVEIQIKLLKQQWALVRLMKVIRNSQYYISGKDLRALET